MLKIVEKNFLLLVTDMRNRGMFPISPGTLRGLNDAGSSGDRSIKKGLR